MHMVSAQHLPVSTYTLVLPIYHNDIIIVCYTIFLAGIALYYIVLQLLLWWLWHTIAVLWGAVWPFHARKFNRSRNAKYLHIIFILVSLILPVIPVVIVISMRGGFTITRAPPILCAGYDLHTNFWGFLFPLNLLLAVGVTLMVFILRIVIKVNVINFLVLPYITDIYCLLEPLLIKDSQNYCQFELGCRDKSNNCVMLLHHPGCCSPLYLH